MNKEEVIKQFKNAHPELANLDPEIRLDFIKEEGDTDGKHIIHDPPTPKITVKHPFIFDKRLIPEDFNGINVRAMQIGNNPYVFPSTKYTMPMEEYFSHERYVRFVDENLPLIVQRLNKPSITREEALDALTGGFEKHVEECVTQYIEKINEEKENIAVFYKLMYKLKQVYLLSDAYQNFGDRGWSYSLTSTKFSKNKPLILGFNWGVDTSWIKQGNEYSPQKEYPMLDFEGSHEELGSLSRSLDFFFNYYYTALRGTQTNFCFFRSKKENQITPKDLDLCKPIFNELINYLYPSSIITFSKQLHNYFQYNQDFKNDLLIKPEAINSGNRVVNTAKGKITINNRSIDYFYLPHPSSYRYHKPEVITKVWEFCFGKRNS